MGRITNDTLERIKERLPVSAVVNKRVQLKRAGRELRGLSPFNAEKTPSFYVNDQKQFYHCFSSGKHGNVFDFVMETEGLDFVEAVEYCAAQAGVEIERDGFARETRESQRARADAVGALQCAQQWFVQQLHRHEPARLYLRCRDLRQRVARELGIGWAPDSMHGLIEHLTDNGFSVGSIVEAGLAIQPEDRARAPFAFFRGRVTFPIRNRKGEVISFGARAIAGEDPKYLNGRETPLFDKGRTLYNLDRARGEIARSGTSIVTEGYFDVATVSQAGIQNIVAPLGTALTVEHLHALWRVAPHIVFCGDGDKAGDRAGGRTVETALPWIAGDRRLSFCALPSGMDPDDLVRRSGVDSFRSALRAPESFVDRLWRLLRDEHPGDQPEDRASIERAIGGRVELIADAGTRRAYSDELLRRARDVGRPQKWGAKYNQEYNSRPVSAIPAREAALMVAAVLHPEYVEATLEQFAAVDVRTPVCAQLRDLVVSTVSEGGTVDRDAVARDVAVLQASLPEPVPSYVARANLDGFRSALEMQGSQTARRRLASFSGD